MITGRSLMPPGGGGPDRVVLAARVVVHRVPLGSAHDKQERKALKAAATAVTRGWPGRVRPWPVP